MTKAVKGPSGKIYYYADDVPDELIVQHIEQMEKPAEWKDVLAQVPAEIKRGAALGIAGLTEAAGDIFGIPTEGKRVREYIQKEREAELPKNMTMLQEGVLSGLASAPEVGASALAAVGATVATANPLVGLAVGLGAPSLSATAREYGEQRAGGMPPGRAAFHAGVHGAGEAVGGLAPMSTIVNKLGKVGFGKFLSEWFGREFTGEQVTTAWQSVNRKLSIQPDLTFEDWLRDAAVTGIATVVGGGAVSPVLGGLHAVAKAASAGPAVPAPAVPKTPQEQQATGLETPPAPAPPVPQVTTENAREVLRMQLSGTPEQFGEFVSRNLPVLREAELSIPEQVAEAVEAGTLTAEQGQAAVAAASAAVSRQRLELEQNVATQTEAAEAAEAAFNVPPAELDAFERGAAAVDMLLAGDLAQSSQEFEQTALAAGLTLEDASNLAFLPESQRREQLTRMRDMYNALRGFEGSEPHPLQPKVDPFRTKFTKSIEGKTITFGPDRGKQVQSFTRGHVNSINESNVVPARLEKRLVAILRRWTQKYLPNMDVVLHIAEPHSTRAGGMHVILDEHLEGRTAVLIINPRSSDTPAKIIEALAHEFGHALFVKYLSSASPKMQDALRQQWRDHLLKHWDKPLVDYVRSINPNVTETISHRTVGSWLTQAWTWPISSSLSIYYWPNFWEFHALNMERVLLNDIDDFAQPVRTFWREAFEQLRKFFVAEHPLWAPGQSMREWLRLGREREFGKIRAEVELQEHVSRAQDVGLDAFAAPQAPAETTLPPQAIPASIAPDAETVASFRDLSKKLKQIDPVHGPELFKAEVKFSEKGAWFLGSFQILKMNLQIPGVGEFLKALRGKMGYKNKWTREANMIANDWEALGKEQAGRVAKLLFTEAETGKWYSTQHDDPKRPGRKIFVLDENRAKEFGIDQRGAEIYSRVRSAYMAALDSMEEVGVERIMRTFADDPENLQAQLQLKELRESYQQMREKPYTPASRFGQFYVRIVATEPGWYRDPYTQTSQFFDQGATVYFETFESETDRELALKEISEKYKDTPVFKKQISLGKIHEIVYSLRNLPPAFLEGIIERLNLTPEQITEYRDLIRDLAADTSFIKHMKRKANVAGYSPDALRGFADYMQRFANNFAKTKTAPAFDDALRLIREHKKQIEEAAYAEGRVPDTTDLDKFYDWAVRTRDYVMNPGNEWGELKSFVAAWYLGLNLATLVTNITQVPFFTLPYLAKRVGWTQALGALQKATRDVSKSWKDMKALTVDEQAMLSYALDQGFIDESFATSVAQFAEGSALTRLSATATRHRLLNRLNHVALWAFQKTEEFNRRVSLLATYRLYRSKGFEGAFDQAAFDAARNAVEVTQNEYALENRPEFMRGRKSVIFQFMHYQQNAIFQMLGGDKSWAYLLATQLSVAGLLGLPFAEDLLDLAKMLAKLFGIQFEPKLAAKQLLEELNLQPDLVLRGLASQAGYFDLSYRYSLGRVIPGMEAAASNQPFAHAITAAVGDVGGAGASIVLNAMKAMSNLHSPDKLQTLSYVAPAFMRYPLNALRAAEQGGVYTQNMALIAPLDTPELIGMGLGFQPRAATRAWSKIGFQREIEAYWVSRRQALLENFYWALRAKDREALADLRKRLREYNLEARKVDRALVIDRATLYRSMKQRQRVVVDYAAYGTPGPYRDIARDVQGESEG